MLEFTTGDADSYHSTTVTSSSLQTQDCRSMQIRNCGIFPFSGGLNFRDGMLLRSNPRPEDVLIWTAFSKYLDVGS